MPNLKRLDADIFPTDTEQLAVLETRRVTSSAEDAKVIARTLKIEGEVRSEAAMHIVSDGPKTMVLYEETGAFWFLDSEKLDSDDYAPTLPSKRNAQRMATKFLRANDWLPQGFVRDGADKIVREIIRGKNRGKRKKLGNCICVNFRARVGKIDSYGPGAKIKVFIGHEDEIIGLFHAVVDWQRYAEFPLRSFAEIEEILEQKLGHSPKSLDVVNARLVYHSDSCVEARRFVQPALLFEFESQVESARDGATTPVQFELRPIPATSFAPVVTIETDQAALIIDQGERLELRCRVSGGTEPYGIRWSSDFDGELGTGADITTRQLSIAHRAGDILPHAVTVTATDRNGMMDSHTLLVTVKPTDASWDPQKGDDGEGPDPFVGVEWCNVYGSPGLSNISGTDDSAKGFKDGVRALPGWSSRFDWGNAAAWEEDFKSAGAPSGGTDYLWVDNVHFAFFAGHGSSGRFWFGSTRDDHEMRAQDASWGEGHLNWIVLHACQTMRSNFEWDVWCDAFNGLHQMFGFHTNTQGSTPPLGTRFAFWASFRILPWTDAFPLRTAWRIACQECYDASREYSMIYAGKNGTDTPNDHLPGFGYVSPDPTSPSWWGYSKGTC